MKKILKLTSLISQFISIILLFMPVFVEERWVLDKGSIGAYSYDSSGFRNFFITPGLGVSNEDFILDVRFNLSIFVVIIMAVACILMFLNLLGKTNKFKKLIALTPCLPFFVFGITSWLYIANSDCVCGTLLHLNPTFGFYFIIAFQIVTITCSVLAGFKTFNDSAQGKSTLTNADEIKKYNNLLNDGIITQEEFNAKKKQLLGL